jgi:hypothetical protein
MDGLLHAQSPWKSTWSSYSAAFSHAVWWAWWMRCIVPGWWSHSLDTFVNVALGSWNFICIYVCSNGEVADCCRWHVEFDACFSHEELCECLILLHVFASFRCDLSIIKRLFFWNYVLSFCKNPSFSFNLEMLVCVRFVHTIHSLGTPFFNTINHIDALICKTLFPMICCCTEYEAGRLGRFLCETLKMAYHWKVSIQHRYVNLASQIIGWQ